MTERFVERRDIQKFPPALIVGSRVWTDQGYQNHGPLEGPKVDIAPGQSGTITAVEKPYLTMDHLLYAVRWDNGQVSKHYSKELFCIGPFQNRGEFEKAINPTGTVELTVGPAGGFRNARFDLEYNGQSQTAEVADRRLWLECVEPLVRKSGLQISTTKLRRGE
jgi:hypothetical protein